MSKNNTGPRWSRVRLIGDKTHEILSNGRLGREVKPRVNLAKLNSPAASEPDEDIPLLTMRDFKQFHRAYPPATSPSKTKRIQQRSADVAALRKSLHMSQAVFAEIFQLSVATIRDWESRRRKPDGPARVLLKVIARDPEAVRRALAA
jgi:putative transcriptional regulator